VPKLLHIAAKDFRIIIRDKAAFLIMLAMPLALIFILGSALGGIGESAATNIDVAIVNDDTGDAGEEFADALTGIEDLQNLFNMEVRDDADLLSFIYSRQPGDKVELGYYRGGKAAKAYVILGSQPGAAGADFDY
jgi:hypothetical protein